MFECKDNTFILKTTLLFRLILVLIFIKVHSVKSIHVNSTSKCKFTELVRKSSPVVF